MKQFLLYVFARAPLPMLALAASYGVYQFNLLFTPVWVALVSAAAFELTYVALAFTPTDDTKRATYVSIAAVVVSVLYNVLAALFVRRPEMLVGTPWYGDVLLATLHGAPLAIMAYNVAALLLHSQRSATLSTLLSEPVKERQGDVNVTVNNLTVPLTSEVNAIDDRRSRVKALVDSGMTVKDAASSVGVSRQTASKYVKG